MSQTWTPPSKRSRMRLIADAIVVVLYGAFCLVAAVHHVSWLGFGATAALLIATLIRYQLPRMTLALAWVGGLIQVTGKAHIVPPADLYFWPIAYSFGVSRASKLRRAGLYSSIAGALLAGVIAVWYRQPMSMSPSQVILAILMYIAAGGAVVIGGWLAGYLRWQSQGRLETSIAMHISSLEQLRLQDAVEQATLREEIASEMHDVVGHSWAVVAAQADGARYLLRTNPDAAEQALTVIAETARDSIGNMRELLRQLRFQEGAHRPPTQADLQSLIERMTASGMKLQFEEHGQSFTPGVTTLIVHRILTEAFTNVLKHGDLQQPVTASLTWSPVQASLQVVNQVAEGAPRRTSGMSLRGTKPGASSSEGHGLAGMRRRAELAGGQCEVVQNGSEWRVNAIIPLAPSPTQLTSPSMESLDEEGQTPCGEDRQPSGIDVAQNQTESQAPQSLLGDHQ